MAEPIKISTDKYNKQGKVNIDGHIWTVKLPGAGTELKLSQAFRGSKLWAARLKQLDSKIDNGKITDQELDNYEEYVDKYEKNEKIIFQFFYDVFRDDTKDNSEVKQWVNDTPTAIIQQAFEDIKQSANGQEEPDGSPPTTGSTE